MEKKPQKRMKIDSPFKIKAPVITAHVNVIIWTISLR